MSETNLPANIPASGNLPATYEAARNALTECTRVDECKSWADKAAALASYARQAKDDSLRLMALRIQDRATRRIGELLKQLPSGSAANLIQHRQEGAHPSVKTRSQAASEAGLSEHQRKTSIRLANVPADEFEAAVESANPPTITELAARGTVSRPVVPTPAPSPADPRQVAEVTTLLRQFATFCGTTDAAGIACAQGADADVLRNYVGVIDRWLDRFVTHLRADAA